MNEFQEGPSQNPVEQLIAKRKEIISGKQMYAPELTYQAKVRAIEDLYNFDYSNPQITESQKAEIKTILEQVAGDEKQHIETRQAAERYLDKINQNNGK